MELVPQPLSNLLRRVERDRDQHQAVFDLPLSKMWRGSALDVSRRFHGERASTPVGPAAGPHTQLAQNIALSYTDQGSTAGNTLPVTVAMTASGIVGHISHAGVAANNYGPFLPLASGDSGVQNVATVTMSAANTGTFALCLARPLATITLSVAGLMTEKDLLNQIPSLPEIKDGACLVWLYGAGAATAASTTFAGGIEVVWG